MIDKLLYEVRIASKWYKVRRVEIFPSGWMNYELYDGTIGLAQPKNWRVNAQPKPFTGQTGRSTHES